jgi:hypothetical protein
MPPETSAGNHARGLPRDQISGFSIRLCASAPFSTGLAAGDLLADDSTG